MTDETPEAAAPPRTQGQDFGITMPVFAVPETPRIGHKADHDAYTRSRNKTYKRKIEAQRKRTK